MGRKKFLFILFLILTIPVILLLVANILLVTFNSIASGGIIHEGAAISNTEVLYNILSVLCLPLFLALYKISYDGIVSQKRLFQISPIAHSLAISLVITTIALYMLTPYKLGNYNALYLTPILAFLLAYLFIFLSITMKEETI